MIHKEYLTKEKYDQLAKELEDLKTTKRKEVAEQLQYAKGLGDLSENAEYHEARDKQASVESRILQLENMLKHAEIVVHKTGDIVEIGSEVTVLRKGETKENTYTIVGLEEADMSSGKISNQSPLGQSLLGKKKGEVFEFKTPKGKIEYKIVSVK